ncbi:hypothetical protein GCM10010140_38950 [Streptosporangium pseudovulgare]|uniref:Uncharacterized protein n=1 Tax=Streptosporangium pseudovulgare TaxID=35765 RepID=A0ABQ2R1E4_9ACTN|nr:hypothetical protein GCM10010140_38950 [Streptosporangium pseudovulgare]
MSVHVNVEKLFSYVWLVFVLAIPLLLMLRHRSRTGSWPTALRTASTTFLIIGSWMLLRAGWALLEHGATGAQFADAGSKVGGGLVITAAIFTLIDYLRREQPPAGALRLRDDRQEQELGP